MASADTLTLDHTATQTVSKDLTLTGAANPNRLTLVSDASGQQAKLYLSAGGTQTISDLSVKDSNAGVVPTEVTLVDRDDYQNVSNNTNWQFGAATLTWTGRTSTDWSTASNWNLGVVPIAGDIVIIPGAPSNQPLLSSAVSVGQLNINSGASLTLNGNNLTVTTGAGNFVNNGNLILKGTETVSLTQDTVNTDTGTFTYVGNGTASVIPIISFGSPDYYNLVLNGTNTFQTTTNITTTGGVTVTSGTLDISTHSNTLTVGTALTLGGSTSVLTATNGNISAGSVSIASGDTFTAPAGGTFSVAGNFTNNAGNYGVPVANVTGFNNSSGTVTFTTTATALITGNTIFNNFTSNAAGKTIQITASSTQTVNGTLTLQGTIASRIILVSTGAPWNLALGSTQTVAGVNVEGSDATKTVDCLNCVDSGNNTNWVFETLSITDPASGTTVGQTPTIIGQAPPPPVGGTIYIRDINGKLVATTKVDTNGNFRVVVGKDDAGTSLTTTTLDTGPNSLTPYLTSVVVNPGAVNNFTVVLAPTYSQVPVITAINGVNIPNPTATQFINGSNPTISGQSGTSQNGQVVKVQALDANGNLILSAGSGTDTVSSGVFSVALTTALPSATNYLSVTVNGVASALIKVSLTDPFGVVYNSTTNQPIQGAIVTLYDANTNQVSTGGGLLKSCTALGTCCDMSGNCTDASGNPVTLNPPNPNPPANPFTTGSDGFYSFLAPHGNYYIKVSAAGYTYPSIQTTAPPSGRIVGSVPKARIYRRQCGLSA